MNEKLYWIISLLILAITAYAVYISPIKAVKIGRKLNKEQNKYDAKRDLFLELFSLRGNPSHYDFVNSLNKIDVVFQDEKSVLEAWNKLFESLRNPNQIDAERNLELLRTNLLSEMARRLDYGELEQTKIQQAYTPKAHSDIENANLDYRSAAKAFFQSGARFHKILISQFQNKPE